MTWARSKDNIEWGWGKVLHQYEKKKGQGTRVQVLFGQDRIVLFDAQQHRVEFLDSLPSQEETIAEFFKKIQQGEYANQLEAERELSLHLETILDSFQYPNSPEGKEAFLREQKKLVPEGEEEDFLLQFDSMVEKRREELSIFIRTSLKTGGTPLAIKSLIDQGNEEVREVLVASLMDYPTSEAGEILMGLLCTCRVSLFDKILKNLSHWGKLEGIAPQLQAISQGSCFPGPIRQRALRAFLEIQKSPLYRQLIERGPRNFWEDPKGDGPSTSSLFSLLLTFSAENLETFLPELLGSSLSLKEEVKKLWTQHWKALLEKKALSLQRKYLQNFLVQRMLSFWVSSLWDPSGSEIPYFFQKLSFVQARDAFSGLSWKVRKKCLLSLLNSFSGELLSLGLSLLSLEKPERVQLFQNRLEEISVSSPPSHALQALALLSFCGGKLSASLREALQEKTFPESLFLVFSQPLAEEVLCRDLLPPAFLKAFSLYLLKDFLIEKIWIILQNQKKLIQTFEDKLDFYTFLNWLTDQGPPKPLQRILVDQFHQFSFSLLDQMDLLYSKGEVNPSTEEKFLKALGSTSSAIVANLLERKRFFSFQSDRIRCFLLERGARTLTFSHFERALFQLSEENAASDLVKSLVEGVFKKIAPHNLAWKRLFQEDLFKKIFREVSQAFFETKRKTENIRKELSLSEEGLKKKIETQILPLLKRLEGQSQGMDYLQAHYQKLIRTFENILSPGKPLSSTSGPTTPPTSSEKAWEELQKLNKDICQTVRISQSRLRVLKDYIYYLQDELIESLPHHSPDQFFTSFHPLLLTHLWNRWWEMGVPLERGQLFEAKIIPLCQNRDSLWQWCLSFLSDQIALHPSLCNLWENSSPDFLPELFNKVHQGLWKEEETLQRLLKEQKKRERQFKISLAQEIHLPLKAMEKWISYYEEFRFLLEEMGFQKAENFLGVPLLSLDSHRHASFPEGSFPQYLPRSYGLSVQGEVIIPSSVEGVEKGNDEL